MTRSRFPYELPVPSFFDPERMGEIWKVPFQERALQARAWSREHQIQPASKDKFRIGLIAIDVQNTFCIPDFELFVGGRSENGAVEDNRRLCEFIYRNLSLITQITATLDTHQAVQIFHSIFLVNDQEEYGDGTDVRIGYEIQSILYLSSYSKTGCMPLTQPIFYLNDIILVINALG